MPKVALRMIPDSLATQPIFLCVDDTMVAKTGTRFENVSKLFDHAAHNGSNYLNGHCFVNIMLIHPLTRLACRNINSHNIASWNAFFINLSLILHFSHLSLFFYLYGRLILSRAIYIKQCGYHPCRIIYRTVVIIFLTVTSIFPTVTESLM